MAHCYYHALSSVRKWGGTVDDYLPLHQWFDQSKARAQRQFRRAPWLTQKPLIRPSPDG